MGDTEAKIMTRNLKSLGLAYTDGGKRAEK